VRPSEDRTERRAPAPQPESRHRLGRPLRAGRLPSEVGQQLSKDGELALEARAAHPGHVHHGRTGELELVGASVLAGAYAAYPERFVKGLPIPKQVRAEVWINPPLKEVPRA